VNRANTTLDSYWVVPGTNSNNNMAAIAKFSDDAYPEVAVNQNGRLWLMAHDGTPKWGPSDISFKINVTAAPVVANFDDGPDPEIAVGGDGSPTSPAF